MSANLNLRGDKEILVTINTWAWAVYLGVNCTASVSWKQKGASRQRTVTSAKFEHSLAIEIRELSFILNYP
jgi:hypothetical protein